MTLDTLHLGSGSYQTKVEADRRFVSRYFNGRVGPITGFTLSQPAGMNMGIAAGEAVVPGLSAPTTQGSYWVSDTASTTVAWPAAAASPRIDALVLAVGDTQYGALGASMGGTVGPKWIVVQGTPNASPVAPTDATIQTAVGAGGWIRVADVRINVGDTTIAPANVTLKWTDVNSYLAYTPSVQNAVVSVAQGSYIQMGKKVHAYGIFTVTSTSAAMFLGLPVPAKSTLTTLPIGTWVVLDVGTTRYSGVIQLRDANTFYCFQSPSATAVGGSVPMVWAAGDQLTFEVTYEAA